MKLRDSFISIQHISNELNIPLTSPDSDAKATDIFPSDYESSDKEKSLSTSPQHQETIIMDNNIKIIDKATKASGTRVRNLKKSMLNDNKLIRLRDKLLRRSKSSAGLVMKKDQDFRMGGDSKEEYQNKENELPKQCQNSEPLQVIPSQIKVMSPTSRNRVKMGTRVFSSQFLNKSFDNIYDNAMSVYHYDDEFDHDVIQEKSILNYSGRKGIQYRYVTCFKTNAHQLSKKNLLMFIYYSCIAGSGSNKRKNHIDNFDGELTTDSSNNGKGSGRTYYGSSGDADRLSPSLKSTSLSSLYFSEKMSGKFSESPLPSEAYVIRKYLFFYYQAVFMP